MKKLFALLAALVCASVAFGADLRVQSALDDAGLKYTIDDDGDFRLLFGQEDDRSQLVWINSNTEEYGNMELREVWGIGYRAGEDGSLSRTQLLDLLKRNNTYKLGSWRLSSNGQNVIFTITVDADADGETLDTVARYVADLTDELEKDWDGGDEL